MFPAMGTLAEIEAAVPGLNTDELERLEAKLREIRRQRVSVSQREPTDLTEFAGSLRLTEDPLGFQRRMREEWG